MQQLASRLAPQLPHENFTVADIAQLPFQSQQFDVVISSAVLHFARDEQHFHRMVDEMWRVLKPQGLLFARLASTIGIENRVQAIRERWYLLPDGTERFLVDEPLLLRTTERLGGVLLEPLKTTNVQNLRCMTTWVVRNNDIFDSLKKPVRVI